MAFRPGSSFNTFDRFFKFFVGQFLLRFAFLLFALSVGVAVGAAFRSDSAFDPIFGIQRQYWSCGNVLNIHHWIVIDTSK